MDNYIYIYMIIKGCVSTCQFISAWPVQDLLTTALDLKGQVFIVFPGRAVKPGSGRKVLREV
jgi:hypothetical protein